MKLKKWRELAEMSQAEASRRVGVSRPAWCQWEGFHKRPGLKHATDLETLTAGLVATADWLVDLPAQESAA